MELNLNLVKKLREETGAGIVDCRKALMKTGGNLDKAVNVLRTEGQKIALKKQSRETKQGVVGIYHHANGKIGALVALTCETDFVARTEEFKELAHDLAMQVAATDPFYLTQEDVPSKIIKKEEGIYCEQLINEGKPKKILDKIIQGKLDKYFEEICLVKQKFIKDDKITIEQLVEEKIAKFGENIQIKEFKRLSL